MAKTKILFFIPSDIIGGAETQTAVLCKYLDKSRFEIAVAAPPVHPTYYGFVDALRPLVSRYAEVADYRQLAAFIRSFGPDILQYGHSFWPTDALMQIPEWKGRVVEIVHGRHPWDRDATKVPKTYTSAVVSVSADAEAFFLGIHPEWKTRSLVIPNGIDLARYTSKVNHLDSTASRLVYLHVGRLCEGDKRQSRMIELCKVLAPGSWQLHLVGDGADRRRVEAAMKQAPRGHVWLTGFKADPLANYLDADIYLSLSRAEGFALNIAEAAACGLPIVMWDCGGISRSFTDGVDAFIVNSEQAFVDSMNRLAADRMLRAQMGARARELVFREFDAAKMAKKYEGLYDNGLSCTPAGSTPIEKILECVANVPKCEKPFPPFPLEAIEADSLKFAADVTYPIKSVIEEIPVRSWSVNNYLDPLASKSHEKPTYSNEVKAIKPMPKLLGISNHNWKGVSHATQAWVGDHWLGVSHEADHRYVAAQIRSSSPDVLILGGDSNYLPLCRMLRNTMPRLKIMLTWHSYPSSHSFLPQDANLLGQWLQALDNGFLDRIGFVRPRFHKVFRHPKCVYFPNRLPEVIKPAAPLDLGSGLHFGAISTSATWKNTEGTLLLAGSYPSSTVHVTKTETRGLLHKMGIRVEEHAYQDKAGFHRLLASMDLNLLLSFGEAYNMTFMESWLLGKPCLTSATTDLHADLDFTRVRSYDDVDEVWGKIEELLNNPRVDKAQGVLRALDAENQIIINKVLEAL